MQTETSATFAARETPARTRSRYCWEYRFTRHRLGESPGRIESPEQVVEILGPVFEGAESEVLAVALLDRRHNVIGIEVLYKGHVAGTPVRIGEMFRAAVRVNASAIVLAHQHPSGDPTPSPDDLRTTRDAQTAGALLGIEVLDHVVIGAERYHSIADGTMRAIPHSAPFTTREGW